MDPTVLYNLTYGLYVVGVMDGERPVGCVINTCYQVTSQNPILAISLNKNNFTLDAIRRNRRYSLSILNEDSDPTVIGTFGFHSSRDTDKYADYGYDIISGAPVVRGTFAGRLILEALDFVDCETHVLVLGRLVDTDAGEGTPMTYAYYHKVIKGKAPKNAPTYREEKPEEKPAASNLTKYRCDLCGYEVEVEGELPADFTCPLCGASRDQFSKV